MDQNSSNSLYAPPQARVADPEPEQITARPQQVLTAVWLLWISFGIGALNRSLIYPLVTGTSVSSIPIAVVGTAIAILVTLWISRKVLLGRNWMRIMCMVFFVFGLLMTPFTWKIMFHGSADLMIVYGIQSTIQAIFLWLLFTKPGSDWFRKRND